MKIICVFSIHRTGTNYLGSVLRQWPDLSVFGEIFHPDRVHGLKPAHLRALANVAGREFATDEDPGLIPWLRAHPAGAVEALRRVARRKEHAALYFKVFLGHWTLPVKSAIEQLAKFDGFTPVLLQRRCLDTYVSYRKAEAAGIYKHVDTTDAPEDLDPARYAHWADVARRWYEEVLAALVAAGKPPLRVTYERDVDLPPDALSGHWGALLALKPPATFDPASALSRQDRSADLAAKIRNFAEFGEGLKRLGLWEEGQGYFVD